MGTFTFNADYQTVKSIQFEGNYNTAYITENNRYGAKTLFANWDENANKRALTIKLVLETQDREPMQQGYCKAINHLKRFTIPLMYWNT